MIISKTPFRISFAGGGSDLRSFYRNETGAVLSTTIDKYINSTNIQNCQKFTKQYTYLGMK